MQRLDVGPLEDDAAAELVHATAEGGGMPADVLGFILKHSQGMPLQLEQMTRSLVASSLLFLNEEGVSRHATPQPP